MMTKNKTIPTLMILLAAIGCSGSKSGSDSQTAVRSDLADYVKSQYPGKDQLQNALLARARLYQKVEAAPSTSANLRPELEKSLRCVRNLEPEAAQQINRDFSKQYFNNQDLLKAYAKFNKSLSGGVYAYQADRTDDCNN